VALSKPERSGPRLWVRLLALVLVPVSGMTYFAASAALQRADDAVRAVEMESRANELIGVVRLGFKLLEERVPTQGLLVTRTFGMTDAQAKSIVGFDLKERLATGRAETDAQLDRLGHPAWLADGEAQLREVRLRIDAGRTSEADVRVYEQVQAAVEQKALGEARWLENEAAQVAEGSDVGPSVRLLRLSFQAAQAGLAEFADLFAVTSAAQATAPGRAKLAATHARYQALTEDIAEADGGQLVDVWNAIQANPSTDVFEAAVQRVSTGDGPIALTRDRYPELFRAGLTRFDLHARLVEAANRDVAAAVTLLRDSAESGLRLSVATAAALGLITLLGAWFIARGVARPLMRLADRARRVNQGELDVDLLHEHGPSEVRAVSKAFNDMVGTLRLVETQARALAVGETTHEVVAQRLPGMLGQSLQGSVDRLSRSIAERDALEYQLRHEATHDALTGLLNRAAATVSLEHSVARARRTGEYVAVLFIDLDDFKRANDTHGHQLGDEVLRQCAVRLTEATRDSDTVARLGGDEFLVIAEVDGVEAAVDVGQRVLRALSESVDVDGTTTRVGASVGIALMQDGDETAMSLLRDADIAVYRAKAAGKSRVELFDVDLRRQLDEHDDMERALSRALEDGELELHYQPVVDTASGTLQGFEALCRWTDPIRGSVPPSAFIPVAEASDLIVALGRWVLHTATRQLVEWDRTHALGDVHVAVNVSGRHLLGAGIIDDVSAVLAETGLAPHRLVIEITETVLLSDTVAAADHITRLRALGVQVAIDDFGTGYTSLAHLRRLPVDIVKIDRSFVSGVEAGLDRSLVQMLVQLAHTLGLGLVAEGVETAGQLQQLQALHCEQSQGYYLSRPMPTSAVDDWISSRSVGSLSG